MPPDGRRHPARTNVEVGLAFHAIRERAVAVRNGLVAHQIAAIEEDTMRRIDYRESHGRTPLLGMAYAAGANVRALNPRVGTEADLPDAGARCSFWRDSQYFKGSNHRALGAPFTQ